MAPSAPWPDVAFHSRGANSMPVAGGGTSRGCSRSWNETQRGRDITLPGQAVCTDLWQALGFTRQNKRLQQLL